MEKLKWKKKKGTGIHTFRANGLLNKIHPEQTVICTREELGSAVTKYTLLNEGRVQQVPDVETTASLMMVSTRRSGLYNVINPDNPDKPINAKPMKKDEIFQMFGDTVQDLAG